jgi:hypothetical protein
MTFQLLLSKLFMILSYDIHRSETLPFIKSTAALSACPLMKTLKRLFSIRIGVSVRMR